jgi:hypothetical protein
VLEKFEILRGMDAILKLELIDGENLASGLG